ncbi:MAG TPA: DsrE family protein [Vicinamibacterales bacterium]|nr:DsrE family protein [Vicinamibacterales bacterium]
MVTKRLSVSTLLFAASLFCLAATARAQDKPATHDGPIIKGYGAVFPVPDAGFKPPLDHVFKVVFSVTAVPKSVSALNPGINTVARFLNMQAQAGVPLKNMKLALVLHGPAGQDALDDAGYRSRFHTANPNLPLLDALHRAGVAIYLCGQTAAARGFHRGELAPPVTLALSAMTVITTLEGEGYVLMP